MNKFKIFILFMLVGYTSLSQEINLRMDYARKYEKASNVYLVAAAGLVGSALLTKKDNYPLALGLSLTGVNLTLKSIKLRRKSELYYHQSYTITKLNNERHHSISYEQRISPQGR